MLKNIDDKLLSNGGQGNIELKKELILHPTVLKFKEEDGSISTPCE